jgi:cytochrome c553
LNNQLLLNKLLKRTILCRVFKKGISILVLLVVLFSFSQVVADESPGIDILMGKRGRLDHEERIKKLVFENGKVYGWEEYSSWGKEIFFNGYVKNPPAGDNPSKPISKYFKCTKCHNYEREDPDLAVQDPEARFKWIEKTGAEIYLLQGTTIWGAVNRETYYPDHFSKYHDLCVPKGDDIPWLPCGPLLGLCGFGCRTMKPDSLEDAIQVCSAYCSVGRYLEKWELYALIAFFWDKEITLNDLALSPGKAAQVKEVLLSPAPDPQKAGELRTLLTGKYSQKANNTFRGIPINVIKDKEQGRLVVRYADGTEFTGDAARGKNLWKLSCARCHDKEKHPFTKKDAEEFADELDEVHEMLAEGTRHRTKPYMPNFTLERLSRQQAADILLYVIELSKK